MNDANGHSDNAPVVASDAAGVVQRTIITGELPALIVVHDDEGDWLIGDGVNDPNEDGACGVYHLDHVVRLDKSLAEVLDIPMGHAAIRSSASASWEISPWAYED